MKNAQRILAAASMVMLTALPPCASAEYPDKPVVLVVPFAVGGPTDKIARELAEALRKPLGRVIVENTGGAGGTIGVGKVARANPDGYTLLVHHIGMATTPALYRKLTYKTPDDFDFLGLINEAPSTLIGRPALPANNFTELRDWVAGSKGQVNLANAGIGSASHLCGLLLQSAMKADITTVPYKGTGPAMTDLMGGQVDLMCEQVTNAVPQIESKKVKVYGVTSEKRVSLPLLAEAPTLAESGLQGFNMTVWHGLYAPKGTPAPIASKLNAALREALKDPDLIRRQEALGITVVTDERLDPAGHRKFVESEIAKWGPIIKAAGQYAD